MANTVLLESITDAKADQPGININIGFDSAVVDVDIGVEKRTF